MSKAKQKKFKLESKLYFAVHFFSIHDRGTSAKLKLSLLTVALWPATSLHRVHPPSSLCVITAALG